MKEDLTTSCQLKENIMKWTVRKGLRGKCNLSSDVER